MTTIKQVLDQKGHDVHCIHPDASVFDALKMMAENNIGSLVVLETANLSASLPNGITRARLFKRQDVTRNSGPRHYVDQTDLRATRPTETTWSQRHRDATGLFTPSITDGSQKPLHVCLKPGTKKTAGEVGARSAFDPKPTPSAYPRDASSFAMRDQSID